MEDIEWDRVKGQYVTELLERPFRPKMPGTYIVTTNYQVRVDMEEQVHLNGKYYMVDVEVIA